MLHGHILMALLQITEIYLDSALPDVHSNLETCTFLHLQACSPIHEVPSPCGSIHYNLRLMLNSNVVHLVGYVSWTENHA